MPQYQLHINGESHTVDAPADMALLWVLRDKLGITGPKYGCGIDACKACTCLINGKAQTTCAIPVSRFVIRGVFTFCSAWPEHSVVAVRGDEGLGICLRSSAVPPPPVRWRPRRHRGTASSVPR